MSPAYFFNPVMISYSPQLSPGNAMASSVWHLQSLVLYRFSRIIAGDVMQGGSVPPIAP
jgi:hypothetical protein